MTFKMNVCMYVCMNVCLLECVRLKDLQASPVGCFNVIDSQSFVNPSLVQSVLMQLLQMYVCCGFKKLEKGESNFLLLLPLSLCQSFISRSLFLTLSLSCSLSRSLARSLSLALSLALSPLSVSLSLSPSLPPALSV